MIPAGLGGKPNWVIGDDCPDQGLHKGYWEAHDCGRHHERPSWEKHVVPLLEEHIHPVNLHSILNSWKFAPCVIIYMQCRKDYIKWQPSVAVLMVSATFFALLFDSCAAASLQYVFSILAPLWGGQQSQASGCHCDASWVSHARLAYRECHLSNAIEKHLQRGKEEEARIQVSIVNAVWGDVSAKEQRRADDACKCCLQHPANNVSCNLPLIRAILSG